MSETTATHDVSYITVERGVKVDIPVGWLCPRCGAVNAPDVKRCDCKPKNFELPPTESYFKPLPNTVVGPKETK